MIESGAVVSQDIYFYFDDSGVLHNNDPVPFFVYAGYVFLNREEKESANRRYRSLNRKIKTDTMRLDELKACNLKIKHKDSLCRVMTCYHSQSLVVHTNRVYSSILSDTKAIGRYKDFVLKLVVKNKIQELIGLGLISEEQDTKICIQIDEQLTSSNGFYDLKSSIVEELKHGIANYDYHTFYPPIFKNNLEVDIHFCDSSKNYLVQASDILANRIYSSYRYDNYKLRNIKNHFHLTFP